MSRLPRESWTKRARFGGANSAIAGALYNDADPRFVKLRETRFDRMVLEAAKTGMQDKEIAAMLGLTQLTVRNTLRQPWARQMLIESMREAGQETLKTLLKRAAEKSLQLVEEIIDDKAVDKELRFKAASSMLDRWLGRPAQTIDHNVTQNQKPIKQLTDEELMAAVQGEDEARRAEHSVGAEQAQPLEPVAAEGSALQGLEPTEAAPANVIELCSLEEYR